MGAPSFAICEGWGTDKRVGCISMYLRCAISSGLRARELSSSTITKAGRDGCMTHSVRLRRIRPEGAPGCCHGWSPPEADGTRGAGMLYSSSPRMGRRVCANGYESAHLRPCRGGDRGWIFPSTGCAWPALRRTALHPWQQPSVPPGPSQCRLNCHAAAVSVTPASVPENRLHPLPRKPAGTGP